MTKKELQKIKRRGIKKSDIPALISEIERLQEVIIQTFATCVGLNTFWTEEEIVQMIDTSLSDLDFVQESIGGVEDDGCIPGFLQ